MTKDKVLEIFDELLGNNQENFDYKDSKEELMYRLSYNDGLLDMKDKIIDCLREEEKCNEQR